MNKLMRACSVAVLTAAGIGISAPHASALPPETGISYQGQLFQDGMPVDGQRDFRFRLYDDAVAGNLVSTIQLFNVEVEEGLFGVELDWGVAPWEANEQLWLEVEAGPADGMQNYEIISRMKLGAVPYALNTRGVTVDAAGTVGVGPTLQLNNPAESNWSVFSGSNGRFGIQDVGVATRMIIDSQGKVGVGITTPARQFHIDDSFTLAGSSISQNTDLLITSEDSGMTLVSDQSGSVGSYIDLMEQTGAGELIDNWTMLRRTPLAGSRLEFRYGSNFGASNNDLALAMFPGGNVGIGTTSANSRLDIRYADGNGIEVTDTNTASSAIGVQSTVGAGTGVRGESTNGSGSTFGVYGQVASPSGWGVYSNGRLGASGTKSFMIDHPLDPTGSYLLHYSSESPVPQNRYNGNVYLDQNGRGVVTLPDYFAAINTDHRYTLTPIGAPAPNLYIETEIQGNTFVIAGGVSGQKISWEVVSQRNDAFVQQRGAPIEIQKVGNERGKLLVPSLYGQPESMGIYYKAPAKADPVPVQAVD